MRRESTKAILAEAFKSAVKKKPYRKVTITDIVSECDASRTTFYNHFMDKQDLIIWMFVQAMKEACPGPDEILPYETGANRSIQVLRKFEEAIGSSAANFGQNSLRDFVARYFFGLSEMLYTKGLGVKELNKEQREYFEFHMAGGFQLFFSWFDRGMNADYDLIETLKRICPDYIEVAFSSGIPARKANELLDRLYASDREHLV